MTLTFFKSQSERKGEMYTPPPTQWSTGQQLFGRVLMH